MRACFLPDSILTVPCRVLEAANKLCLTSSTRTLIHSWGAHVEVTRLIHPSEDPPKIRTLRMRFQQINKAKGGKPDRCGHGVRLSLSLHRPSSFPTKTSLPAIGHRAAKLLVGVSS